MITKREKIVKVLTHVWKKKGEEKALLSILMSKRI